LEGDVTLTKRYKTQDVCSSDIEEGYNHHHNRWDSPIYSVKKEKRIITAWCTVACKFKLTS
jgi:hypothetical protein